MHSKKKRLIKLFVYDVLPDIRINIPERQLIKKKTHFYHAFATTNSDHVEYTSVPVGPYWY